jgi:hypothetical protein
MTTPSRSSQAIGAELAELRRHLPELPPHNASGVRAELLTRIGHLEREQRAALDRERRPGRTARAETAADE